MPEALLTADQVAEVLGMRIDYVYALCRQDAIPHLRFGRMLRFRRDAIEDWIRASERGTLSASKLNGRALREQPRPGTGGDSSYAHPE